MHHDATQSSPRCVLQQGEQEGLMQAPPNQASGVITTAGDLRARCLFFFSLITLSQVLQADKVQCTCTI